MYHGKELNHDQVLHEKKESFQQKLLNPTISDIKAEKQNFFSELIHFLNIGFGVSNIDNTNIDCDYIQ